MEYRLLGLACGDIITFGSELEECAPSRTPACYELSYELGLRLMCGDVIFRLETGQPACAPLDLDCRARLRPLADLSSHILDRHAKLDNIVWYKWFCSEKQAKEIVIQLQKSEELQGVASKANSIRDTKHYVLY